MKKLLLISLLSLTVFPAIAGDDYSKLSYWDLVCLRNAAKQGSIKVDLPSVEALIAEKGAAIDAEQALKDQENAKKPLNELSYWDLVCLRNAAEKGSIKVNLPLVEAFIAKEGAAIDAEQALKDQENAKKPLNELSYWDLVCLKNAAEKNEVEVDLTLVEAFIAKKGAAIDAEEALKNSENAKKLPSPAQQQPTLKKPATEPTLNIELPTPPKAAPYRKIAIPRIKIPAPSVVVPTAVKPLAPVKPQISPRAMQLAQQSARRRGAGFLLAVPFVGAATVAYAAAPAERRTEINRTVAQFGRNLKSKLISWMQ